MRHFEARPPVEGLSDSLLPVINDAEKCDQLREILRGFSHRCRNSLNGMKLGMYLCKRESPGPPSPVWRDLEQTYELIERTLERLQLIYGEMNLTLIESNLGSMIAEREASWRRSFAERGKTLVIDHPSSDGPGQFDPTYLGLGLDALVVWRAEASPVRTRARLGWRCQDDQFLIQWHEEKSTPRDDRHASEPPGLTNPPERPQRQVDMLTLPLLSRIIRAHDGRLRTAPKSNPPLHINWPRTRSRCHNF
jgi:hypothetical protein